MKKHVFLIATLSMFAVVGCAKDDAEKKAAPAKAKAPTPAQTTPAKAEIAKADKAAEPKGIALPEQTKAVSVAELDTMLSSKSAAIFDANGAKTREKYGVIPTAHLLTDYANCKDELPDDKTAKLVFYCSNEMCSASHTAAEVAVNEGYTDVNILPPGIMGWVEAGKETAQKAL